MRNKIPTSIVGSVTRPIWLIEARKAFRAGEISRVELDRLSDLAVEITVRELEKTGLDEISDGEKPRPMQVHVNPEESEESDGALFCWHLAKGYQNGPG